MSAGKKRGPKPVTLRITIDPAEAIRRLVNAKPLPKRGNSSSSTTTRKRRSRRGRKGEEAA